MSPFNNFYILKDKKKNSPVIIINCIRGIKN